MLVKDETKYCWVDNGRAGEPQDSIKDAIADYLECISYFDDVARNRDIEWVRVGHPYHYVPEKEHIDELSEELTKVFRAWEKKYGFENNAWVVFETKKYRISDYINK